MSYCRFGTADVYIYSTGDYLICQACLLRSDRPSYTTTSRSKMLDHVQAHRLSNHFVPEYVDDRLKYEIQTEGDEVGDGLRSEDPPADQGAGGADAAGADEGSTP